MDWKPRYIVTKAPDVEGPPIPEDEPCLVIRGQDVLSVQMMDLYLGLYAGCARFDPQVYDELVKHQERLIAWQQVNRDKIKVADR